MRPLASVMFVITCLGYPVPGYAASDMSAGMAYLDVREFGADATGRDDSKPAIDKALAAGRPVYFPRGTYRYHGKMTGLASQANGRALVGDGSANSIIYFSDNAVTAGVEIVDTPMSSMVIRGILFRGPGKTSGTNIHGFYSHRTDKSVFSYNLVLEDVGFVDWSGNGCYVLDWFQTRYMNVYARNIRGNGFELRGDQATTFINSGSFNRNIDGWSWWFHDGNPFLQNLNCENVANGIKFGRSPSHPLGASYAFPSIIGLNIEPVNAEGGIGIYFEVGSNFAYASGVQIYAEKDVTLRYGVYWDYLVSTQYLAQPIHFIGAGKFANRYYINGVATGRAGTIMLSGEDQTIGSNDAWAAQLTQVSSEGGYLRLRSGIESVGQANRGRQYVRMDVKSSNYSVTYKDNSYYIAGDASQGQINISLDPASFHPNRVLVVKKIDPSSNLVRILPYGTQTIDGVHDYTLESENDYVTIVSDGIKWNVTEANVRKHTPSSPRETCKPGRDVTWDGSYIYVCVANNMWKRTSLSTW